MAVSIVVAARSLKLIQTGGKATTQRWGAARSHRSHRHLHSDVGPLRWRLALGDALVWKKLRRSALTRGRDTARPRTRLCRKLIRHLAFILVGAGATGVAAGRINGTLFSWMDLIELECTRPPCGPICCHRECTYYRA